MARNGKVPRPPHPRKRRVPLPWQHPKPSREDARAPKRLAAILASPSYQEADRDLQFLREDDSRGLRLELEYTKAEMLLRRHGIRHTILVLGSTRVRERRGRLSRYYRIAREFGRIVARAGKRRGAAIVTGGGPGIMEAANRGAFDAGAPSIGLNITLPQEQFPNPYVTPALCMRFRYFALRKLHFLLRARALVAFPGGFGTFDELFETLTLVQTRKIRPLPIVLVGREYWQRAFNPGFLMQEGTIDPEDGELFWFAESAAEAWRGIRRWYRLAGEPVFPPLRLSDIKQRSAGARRIAL
ncbi:MAG TPA: TIGR00730 family Rossman fold protein [Burkholderiales bacterium]|nr:TIGR00730 family Rossman fold protein [Burkholderiales bacterium]